MSTLRAAQKRMTYELFLDKGLELFGEKGYAATTVDDIASAAGSTRTTFYLHFASKAELMSALLQRVDTILTAADDPTLTEVVESGSRELITDLDRPQDHPVGRDQALPRRELPGGARASRHRADRGLVPGRDGRHREGPRAGRAVPRRPTAHALRSWPSASWSTSPAATSPSAGPPSTAQTALEELTDSWCHLLAAPDPEPRSAPSPGRPRPRAVVAPDRTSGAHALDGCAGTT